MTEASLDQLRRAVESLHGGKATFVQDVPVHETLNGRMVWDGVVSIFDLRGSTSEACRAYACERQDGKEQVFTIIHSPRVASPRDAVRAAMAAEAKTRIGVNK
jgi:hypothetical protein